MNIPNEAIEIIGAPTRDPWWLGAEAECQGCGLKARLGKGWDLHVRALPQFSTNNEKFIACPHCDDQITFPRPDAKPEEQRYLNDAANKEYLQAWKE